MADAEHTAAGQALGYVYQFQRATYRLLESGTAVVSVGVEHVDDVSVHLADGSTIREQDKATIHGGNPLTDRSVALWKTLSIWGAAAAANPTSLSVTEFQLVTNGVVTPTSLARRISNAKTPDQAQAIATELQKIAVGVRDDLQPFAGVVKGMTLELLTKLVQQTFTFDKLSSAFGGPLEAIPAIRFFGPAQRELVFDGADGFVRRTVLAKAHAGEPTVVERAAFDREVNGILRHVHAAPFTALFDSVPDPNPTHYKTHGFFQQLDWIDTDPEFVRQCVVNYVRAKAARVKWAESPDVISEATIEEYEEDLRQRWGLVVQRQKRRSYSTPVEQGQERLDETLKEDPALMGQVLPKPITCGNFHRLADFTPENKPQIGWHPDFKKLAKGAGGT